MIFLGNVQNVPYHGVVGDVDAVALELDGTLLGSDLACFYEQKGGGVVV